MRIRLAVVATAFSLAGCATEKPPAPPPVLHLSRVSFDQLPGWQDSNAKAALASFTRGCAILVQKPDATSMGGTGYAGTIGDWRNVCANAHGDPKSFFASNFTPYAVWGGALFTGYYEPQIQGSRKRHDGFQTPVYGLPSDLVRADLGLFDSKLKGEHISGRVSGQELLPYPDRTNIETNGVDTAAVLFYTNDPVAFFFLQIQGSGRVEFEDGTTERIAYAGQNGQPYTAIGRVLIADGSLAREDVSLQSIRAWLLAHPDKAQSVMQVDKSYVFFAEMPLGNSALGSLGTLRTNLTPLASLAVDPRIHALGVPVFAGDMGFDVHRVGLAEGRLRPGFRAGNGSGFIPSSAKRSWSLPSSKWPLALCAATTMKERLRSARRRSWCLESTGRIRASRSWQRLAL